MFRFNQIAATTYPKQLFRSFSRRAKSRRNVNDGNKTYERKVLPAELSTHTAMLTCKSSAKGGVCHVYLVGTNHSCKAVFLEFCNNRRYYLDGPEEHDALGGYWGGESSVAYEEAMKYGARVYLGDRDIYVKKTFYGSHSIGNYLLWNHFFPIFPYHMETVRHERDQYLSATLLQVSRQHNSVVAVVGRGHLQGIQKHWEQPVDMQPLLSMPSEKKRKPMGEILIYIGATMVGVVMVFINHQ